MERRCGQGIEQCRLVRKSLHCRLVPRIASDLYQVRQVAVAVMTLVKKFERVHTRVALASSNMSEYMNTAAAVKR